MERVRVGIIGATGMVGQNYVRLLDDHPWFQVTHVSASSRSAGRPYVDAVAGRWVMDEPIPELVRDLVAADADDVETAVRQCDVVFSCIGADKQAVRELEERYAAAGGAILSAELLKAQGYIE